MYNPYSLEQQVRHMTSSPSGVQDPRQTASTTPQGTQVWTGSGYHQLSPIRASDITFNRQENRQQVGGWGDYSGPEQWDTTYSYLPQIANQTQYGLPQILDANNFEFTGGDTEDFFNMKMKSGDKEGTNIKYVKQGDYYVPQIMGTQGWDTNKNTFAGDLKATAPVWGGALLGAAGASGMLGSGVQNAMTAPTIGGFEGLGVAGGLSSAAAPAAVAPTAATAAQTAATAPTAGSVFGGADLFGSAAAGIPEGTLAGSAGSFGSMAAPEVAGGLPSWMTLDNARRGYNAVNSFLPDNNPNSQRTGRSGSNNLAGFLAALYGGSQQGDYARDLQSIANQMRDQADPYMAKLRASYEDPNAYFESPDVKARLELEANKLMGLDSSRGRLSNPIERDMLLQKYAAKDIGDYRSGLNTAIGKMYQPQAIAELLSKGSLADNTRWSGLPALLGSMTQGGTNFSDIFDDISKTIESGGDLWDTISGWWD